MQRLTLPSRLLFSAVLGAMALAAQPAPQRAAIYTAAQAQSGRAIYNQNCSACHGLNFEGTGDSPALAGGTFMLKWGPKMVSELFGVSLERMPPTNPGSLGEGAALNVTAFILQRNGAPAGPQALTSGASTLIRTIATGQAPPGFAPVAGGGGRGAAGAGSMVLGAGSTSGQARGGATARRGVSVVGEVKNYVPVTSAMLKNPPAGDWLIFGRNYQ